MRLHFLHLLDIISFVKSIAVNNNFYDVQPGLREREALLSLDLSCFSYFERRRTLLCYGCVRQRPFDEFLHYQLSQVLLQGRFVEEFGAEHARFRFGSDYENPMERRCRECAGSSSKKFYPGFHGQGQMTSKLLELPMELHLHIIDLLDLRSAVRFASINSYLRSLLTRPRLMNVMLQFESSAQNQDFWTLREHVPCYGCVKMVRERNFVYSYRLSKYYLGGAEAIERRCRKCDEKHGNMFQRLVEEEQEREFEMEQDSDDG